MDSHKKTRGLNQIATVLFLITAVMTTIKGVNNLPQIALLWSLTVMSAITAVALSKRKTNHFRVLALGLNALLLIAAVGFLFMCAFNGLVVMDVLVSAPFMAFAILNLRALRTAPAAGVERS